MSSRIPVGVLTLLLGTSLLASQGTQADNSSPKIGKKIQSFRLRDSHGKLVALDDFKDRKAVAVVFVGTECPINNNYMPILAELSRKYEPLGVQFLAINSNLQDTPDRVAAHVRRFSIPFPVLKDPGNAVADLFAARRTPEAIVLDAKRTIRYRGRIDDQFGIGYKRAKPTRRDLAIALDEVLAGQPVSLNVTPLAGCIIARAKKDAEPLQQVASRNEEKANSQPIILAGAKSDETITFTKHILPILQRNCQECHRPGQIGPMPFLNFEDVTAWSDTIREVIEENRMPPWYADPHYGKFSNDRRLADADRNTLLQWLTHGTPRGDVRDAPRPREFTIGWNIGKPDLILTMPKAYDVPAKTPKNGIPYQEFKVETNLKEDRWVAAAEAKTGASAVVHHILIFIVPPGENFFPGNPKTPALAGTAPGDMPLILPAGLGKKIPAGSSLIFQMHYTPNGVAQKDQSSVGVVFTKERPRHELITVPIARVDFRIPAGAENYLAEAGYRFDRDAHLINFMPHMHLRGKDFTFEAIYPDGRKEILLSVPRYNFNWQSSYRLLKPIPMPKGSRLHCIAHFDNSAKNPNNPDPTKTVYWGDQTWEEMMIGWTDFIFDGDAK